MIKKKFLYTAIILCLFTGLLIIYLMLPPKNPFMEKTVYIQPGSGVKQISMKLKEEGLIKNSFLFRIAVFLTGNYAKMKSGEYKLHNRMNLLQIINTISNGRFVVHEVTIPEGSNIYQIASILKKENLIESEDEFMAVSKNKGFLKSQGIEADSAEGYLFPDTYKFIKGIPTDEIMATMIKRHRQIWTEELEKKAKKLNLTHHQAITLASIIEKEAKVEEEMPLISSVFHNRLKRRMPLQSDPTVIYAIWERYDGDLKKEDLLIESPYNTYRNVGLPPGPICNPGKSAIVAALFPASTPYIYFVSRNDGSHHFSANLEDHTEAVYKYQINPWKNRKKN